MTENNTLSRTENGNVFKCSGCSKIHIEYKNLNFNFNEKEYFDFAKYFKELDGSYWEKMNSHFPYRKKIIVPVGHSSLNVLLNNEEVQELKKLFSKALNSSNEMISTFNYQLYPN